MIRTSAIISDGTFPCGTAIIQGSTRECFRRAKEAGYDGVQLTVCRTDDYDAAECRDLMEKYGIGISAMATGRICTADRLSMGSGDEENRRACVERLKAFADLSAKLGTPDFGNPAIVIGAVRGKFTDAGSPEEYRRQFDRSIRELTAYCETVAVPVILESFNHVEADVCFRPDETLAYVREVNSIALHMYLDICHLTVEGLDPAEVIREYGRYAFSIDICGENRLAPMVSSLDFPEIVKAILESGFTGNLTFEMPPSPPENNAEESLAYILGLLESKDDNGEF